MSHQSEIAALQERIAKATSDTDTWRSTSNQEKYMEAYCLVEALERQLEALRSQRMA